MKPRYFKSQADFRMWLEKHHATARELWVGFYKKASGKKGLAYPEAVDEALCFGWIDGIKKRVDADSFKHRFTPRTKVSSWSVVNTRRVTELIKRGLVAKAGLDAFRGRDRRRSGIYLYEQRPQDLSPEYERRFKADPRAWNFFQAQPPGYRRLAIGWIMHAKKEETRLKRLDAILKASAEETRTRWM
jgi:uncharacterized protein YdeI (YjbR/CyaY-like superfamily)